MADLKFTAVIHDMHGFWSNHPHRTIRAFMRGWAIVVGAKPSSLLALEVMNRPSTKTLGEIVMELAVRAGYRSFADEICVAVQSEMDVTYVPNLGLKPLIRRLSEMGVVQFLVSNGYASQVKPVVQSWGLDRYLSGIVCRTSGHSKPKPTINFEQSLFRPVGLAYLPQRTLVVGDWIGDIRTAHNNGASSGLLVTSRNESFPKDIPQHELVLPSYIMLQPSELLDIVVGNHAAHLTQERLQLMLSTGITTKTTRIW